MNVPARCWVEISREQIAANYRAVCEAVGPAVQVMGVVKADAYGHGMLEVAQVLAREGARWLAVSSVGEGIILRQAGNQARILVMAGVMPYEWDALTEFDLTAALHSLDDIREADRTSIRHGKAVAFHLKVDTGMNRLGTCAPVIEMAQTLKGLQGARFEGLMTHFASAADYTKTQTDDQIRQFNETHRRLTAAGLEIPYLHLSSTNAIAYARPYAWQAIVRPGHALYGYVSPARGDGPPPLLHVKPALTWKTRIITVKDIPEGALVGYGGSYRAAHPMRIGILAAGYADGIPHRLSNRGRVIAGGKFSQMLGTVSMDLTTVDLSQSPNMKPGDEVTLLGREGELSLDAQQIAKTAGTISYNVLCGISARVKRVYL